MKLRILILIISYTRFIYSQTLFYEDEFVGGATASGGSPGAYATFTPSDFEVFIPAGSSIRKAFLFAGRHGNPDDTEVDLNGISYIFNASNQVSTDFYSPYGSIAAVHAIDVTSDIDTLVSDYSLTVMDSYFGPNDIFLDFYLFITYDNPDLDSTFVSLYVNEQDFDDVPDDPWEFNLPQPLDTACVDVALSLMTGYACFMADGEDVYVNDIYVGTYGGNESNSGDCGGPLGSFTYYDGTLTGLMDDDEDEVVNETDVIAVINNYITVGSSYLELNFDYVGGAASGESSNAIWAAAIIYGEGAEIVDSLLTLSDDATICKGDTIQLIATGDGEISWTPAASLSDAGILEPYAFPDSTTVYFATLDQGCFQETDSIIITVDTFEISLPDDIILCYGESVNIGVDDEDSVFYIWSPENYLDNPFIANPISTPEISISYTLSAVNVNGCEAEDIISITVYHPEINAGADQFISLGGTALINAESTAGETVWTPQEFLECDTCLETTANPLETTTFLIELTDEFGCKAYDSLIVFVISDCEKLAALPNAFSPNGDGINDIFKIITLDNNSIQGSLMLFNRWGELIFISQDISRGWDGTIQGKEALIGSYVFIATIECENETITKKGVVNLIR